jgi:hypothetical protein
LVLSSLQAKLSMARMNKFPMNLQVISLSVFVIFMPLLAFASTEATLVMMALTSHSAIMLGYFASIDAHFLINASSFG